MVEICLKPLLESNVNQEYVSWLNSSEIIRYLGLRHKKSKITSEEIICFITDCEKDKRYLWGIFVDNKHVGNVSCSMWSDLNKWIDISYFIGDVKFQGKGVASKSVAAAINHLFNTGKYKKVEAHAVEENIPSLKLMKKIGMQEEAKLRKRAFMPETGEFHDEYIFGVFIDEWSQDNIGKDVIVEPMKWE